MKINDQYRLVPLCSHQIDCRLGRVVKYTDPSWRNGRDRIVVSTSRCGRDNPGSNPGHGRGCEVSIMAYQPAFFDIYKIAFGLICLQMESNTVTGNIRLQPGQLVGSDLVHISKHTIFYSGCNIAKRYMVVGCDIQVSFNINKVTDIQFTYVGRNTAISEPSVNLKDFAIHPIITGRICCHLTINNTANTLPSYYNRNNMIKIKVRAVRPNTPAPGEYQFPCDRVLGT